MKKWICFCLTLCLLICTAGISLSSAEPEGKPWVNSDLPGNLPSRRPAPEEDFALYVNYDRYAFSGGAEGQSDLQQSIGQQVRDALWNLVENGNTAEARVLRRVTSLIMDDKRREAEGTDPLTAYVKRIRETKSIAELSALCREEGFLFGSPYVTVQLDRSFRNPDQYASVLFPAELIGTAAEQEDNQDQETEPKLDTKAAAEDLRLIGYDSESAEQMAERIAAFQKKGQESMGVNVDPEAGAGENGGLTPEKIREACAPVYDQLMSQGLVSEGNPDSVRFETMSLDAFRYMHQMYRDENLDLFQAMICLSMIRYSRDYLDPASYARNHELTENPDLRSAAWQYMTEHAKRLTEQAYADAFISAEQTETVLKLAEEYKQAMAERLQNCSWLSEESRKRAAAKASAIRVFIAGKGYHRDYEALCRKLEAENLNLLQAAVLIDLDYLQYLVKLSGTPFVPGDPFFTPMSQLEMDAYYEPNSNAFYIKAGALAEKMYDTRSRETILGTLGQTIGHEISHGFDANGIRDDGHSAGVSALTEEDMPKFTEKAMSVVERLNRVELMEGLQLDGQRVFNEMAADLSGGRLTLDLAGKTEGFDYDLFFRTLAGKFIRFYPSREMALDAFVSDPHPPCYVRVNFAFGQYDEFYRTYPTVQEGTAMYVPPEERITLW